MSTITPSGASSAPPVRTRAATTAEPGKGEAGKAASEPEQQPSVTVTLSEYAQKRAKSMREAFGKLREMQARQDESRKDAARQRVEDLKRRIEMLKKFAVALGPSAAKGVLRQLKEMAQELGQAAAVLKEPSGGGASTIGAAQSSGNSDAATNETATTEAVTDAEVNADAPDSNPAMAAEVVDEEAADHERAEKDDEQPADETNGDEQAQAAFSQARNERNERQRRADAEELKKVAAQLKQLLAMARSQLGRKPDQDSKKLVEGINEQLAEVDKAVTDMSGGGLSISVSVGSSLSISV